MTKELLPRPSDLFPRCAICQKEADYVYQPNYPLLGLEFACSFCLYSQHLAFIRGYYQLMDSEYNWEDRWGFIVDSE